VTFETTVQGAGGASIDDASVSARVFMPAMPSMGMPEMHTDVQFEPLGNGRYRGKGNLVMSGSWNVNVTVVRAGEKVGSAKFVLLAK